MLRGDSSSKSHPTLATAPTIPATVVAQPAAAAECDDGPRAPSGLDDDRRRLDDLQGEVSRYRGLLDDVDRYVTPQQAAHDAALAPSQAQVGQLLAALAANAAASSAAPSDPTSAVSSGQSAASSGQPTAAVPYGHTDTQQLFAASQQGDCTPHSAVTSAVIQSADSSANLSAAVSTGLSGVSSANLPVALQQGDCSATGALFASGAGDLASTAAQSNQMPVVSPDQMLTSDPHETTSPLLPEQGDQLLQRQVGNAIAMAQGCNSVADALLCWVEFPAHDPSLNST